MRRRWRAEPVSWASSLARCEVAAGFVAFAADVQGGGQVAAQPGLGAGEAAVHRVKRGGQFSGDFGVTEVDEAVSAPSGQVGEVQGEVRQVLAAGAVADLPGRQVKRAAAGAFLPGGGGHFTLGCA